MSDVKTSKLVALVTGASSGMGKEIARQLLADGYVVYTAARRVEKMADLEKQGAIPIKMDITNEDDVVNLVGKLAKPLIFLRKWFGDRIFDKVIKSTMKI